MKTELNSSRQSAIATYFIDPLIHHYCDFKGTTSRAAYWYFVLFNCLISGAMIGIFSLISSQAGIIINSIWSLVTLLPCLGIAVRRLHDIGKKGTMIFVAFIPFVGVIWLIVLLCQKSVTQTEEPRQKFRPIDIVVCCVCAVLILLSGILSFAQQGGFTSNSPYGNNYSSYSSTAASSQDITNIKSRIQEIYKQAFKASMNYANNSGNIEQKYFTKSLYKKWQKNEKWEASTGYVNLDFDIWTLSQDPRNPKFSIENIFPAKKNQYAAQLIITDRGDSEYVWLTMKQEKGQWLIDDMVFENGQTLREILKRH